MRLLAPMVAVLSSGCSIHPLQQDVTGVPTHVLVQYIRCETRLAIQDKAIELLTKEKSPQPLARRAYRRPWNAVALQFEGTDEHSRTCHL